MKQRTTWSIIALGLFVLAVSFFTITNYLRLNALEKFDVTLLKMDEEDLELLQQEEQNILSDVLAESQLAADEAAQAVDLAFNLLGIFEALSLAITVGAGAALLLV